MTKTEALDLVALYKSELACVARCLDEDRWVVTFYKRAYGVGVDCRTAVETHYQAGTGLMLRA